MNDGAPGPDQDADDRQRDAGLDERHTALLILGERSVASHRGLLGLMESM
jgi:hypothetical protein